MLHLSDFIKTDFFNFFFFLPRGKLLEGAFVTTISMFILCIIVFLTFSFWITISQVWRWRILPSP